MNKSIGVLLSVVIGVILIAAIVFFITQNSGSIQVEIKATPGTKVFAKLPGGEEQFLNSVPGVDDEKINVNVPIEADVILRYGNKEEIIAYEEWQEEKSISVNFNQPISIMINAQQPETYVFIMLPDGDEFIEPRTEDFIVPPEPDEQNTNLIPIRGGGLKIPIGTKIKLVYQDKERIFAYEEYKKKMRISHNFSNP
jgi:archaellin